jgi:hypothetical protein
VKKGENDVFPSLSKGDQAWNLPFATKQDASPLTTKFGTFHWPPSFGLPSLPSFSFFLKARISKFWLSIFEHTFLI